jgi:NAD(P)-dependent dehydrogenase (short-subunit alcohol dehydrogenase family)
MKDKQTPDTISSARRRVVLISGGSGGIGRATADYYAARGHAVYEISRSGVSRTGVTHLDGDVTCPEDMVAAVAEVMEQEQRLDILICNAGMGIGGSVENTPPADFERQFSVNFYGAVNLIQAAVPALRASGGGRILAVSSVAAVVSIPFQAFYSATKAAINQLILALDNELRPFGIQCAALLPGDTRTGFTAHRIINPDEEAAYGQRVRKSLTRMEQDELNGGSPQVLAKALYRLGTRRLKPKPLNGAGAAYRLVLVAMKLLPIRLSNYLVGKLYAS